MLVDETTLMPLETRNFRFVRTGKGETWWRCVETVPPTHIPPEIRDAVILGRDGSCRLSPGGLAVLETWACCFPGWTEGPLAVVKVTKGEKGDKFIYNHKMTTGEDPVRKYIDPKDLEIVKPLKSPGFKFNHPSPFTDDIVWSKDHYPTAAKAKQFALEYIAWNNSMVKVDTLKTKETP
jgi:hypothetical protein